MQIGCAISSKAYCVWTSVWQNKIQHFSEYLFATNSGFCWNNAILHICLCVPTPVCCGHASFPCKFLIMLQLTEELFCQLISLRGSYEVHQLWCFYLHHCFYLVVGTLLSITVPALYSRYEERVDKCCGVIHKKLSQHYKIVDENVISRIPRTLSKDKYT